MRSTAILWFLVLVPTTGFAEDHHPPAYTRRPQAEERSIAPELYPVPNGTLKGPSSESRATESDCQQLEKARAEKGAREGLKCEPGKTLITILQKQSGEVTMGFLNGGLLHGCVVLREQQHQDDNPMGVGSCMVTENHGSGKARCFPLSTKDLCSSKGEHLSLCGARNVITRSDNPVFYGGLDCDEAKAPKEKAIALMREFAPQLLTGNWDRDARNNAFTDWADKNRPSLAKLKAAIAALLKEESATMKMGIASLELPSLVPPSPGKVIFGVTFGPEPKKFRFFDLVDSGKGVWEMSDFRETILAR